MTPVEKDLTVELGRLRRRLAELEAENADLRAGKKPVAPRVREAGRRRQAAAVAVMGGAL